ncbi:hypothetical protein JOF48_000350 [Arthrobacter stackebrandtii]|uniref:Rhamnosyltransferase n=1 Tax=Arthrobacter stackebrandtii TaxID=272161 RepID=A0ABS4YRY3_9MICC|nr:glycosyltransferase [Arthrobacter stackebrandtii]MBP2411551.1 hypothetical protein [Arthrobacter stackebrandtii]PYG99231.1 hypothetical protein CVV67_16020 [Arthrobacter stackebrandtii]
MNATVDHVLLTRFNLPSVGVESTVRAHEGWLRQRVALFERYCLPSVMAQDTQDFHWISYFDPESPSWLRHRIAEWESASALTPVFRESVSHGELMDDLHHLTGGRRQQLLTTNLDNDDGLAGDFVSRLQRMPAAGPRSALYFSRGLIKHGSAVYLRTDRDNAFCSVRENWEAPLGCWADWHNRLGLHMPVVEISGQPAWLQVIHDLNVSNRIHGRRVAPDPYLPAFGALLEDAAGTSRRDVVMDAVWNAPRRAARETLRAAVKKSVMTVAGKEGLDRFKAGLAARK